MMYIEYKTNKLKKCCLQSKEAIKAFGKENARRLMQRIFEIKAADTLADLNSLPPARCHALKGKRKGQFAVDPKHPMRLIFEPLGKKDEIYEDGKLVLRNVTGIKILEVGDYH